MKKIPGYKKRLLGFLLCGALIFTGCPQIAAASEAEETIFDDGGEDLSGAGSSEAEADVSAGSGEEPDVAEASEDEVFISADDGEDSDGPETAGGEETVLLEEDETQNGSEAGNTEETDTGQSPLFTDGTVDAAGSSDTGFLITGWEYNDPDGYLTSDEITGTYTLALGGADTENPENNPTLDDIIEILPVSIMATIDGADGKQEITLDSWTCADYPETDAETGLLNEAPGGSYTFTAALPEGYVLADGAAALSVCVNFGGVMLTEVTTSQPSGSGTSADPYLIGTAAELYWFAAAVNGGSTTICGKLTANITVNPGSFNVKGTYTKKASETLQSWTPIGTEDNEYSGTFDGSGYTISGLYFKNTETNYVGLFGVINKGTVQNVNIASSFFRGKKLIGGIVGDSWNGSITDCVVKDSCYIQGTLYVGGIAGYHSGKSIERCENNGQVGYDTTDPSDKGDAPEYSGGIAGYGCYVYDCKNTGDVYGETYVGGIVGYLRLGGKVKSCMNIGTVSCANNYIKGQIIAGIQSGEAELCYYLANTAADNGNGTYAKTTAQFKSGEVTYLLNGSKDDSDDDLVWKQTLGTDTYPNFTGRAVLKDTANNKYVNGDFYTVTFNLNGQSGAAPDAQTLLSGKKASEPAAVQNDNSHVTGWYKESACTDEWDFGTNTVTADVTLYAKWDAHTYEDSVCTVCGAIKEPDLEDGYYLISNKAELLWFAEQVNAGNTSICGRLTADINMEDAAYTPIGSTAYPYTGTFDGYLHSVTLKLSGSSDYQGLFGVVGGGVTISRVIVKGSVSGGAYTAGIVGGSSGSGKVTITQCGNEANVTGSGANAAGIFGCNFNSKATVTITDCYNTGSISGSEESAAISGWLGKKAAVTNCHNAGSVTGTQSGRSFARFKTAAFTNCYQLDTVGSQTDITSKTTEELASGEVTYLLNGSADDDGTKIWKQTIETDAYPNFKGGKVKKSGDDYVNHEHSWTYSASGATLTATCSGNSTHTASLTLSAPTDLAYDGSAKTAMLSDTSAWAGYGLTVPTISYSGDTTNVTPAGVTASITAGGVTASVMYTITAKSIRPTVDDIAAQTYTGSQITPAVIVKCGDTTLIENTDYTVSYEENINAGTDAGRVTISPVSGSNYTFDAFSKKFTINKAIYSGKIIEDEYVHTNKDAQRYTYDFTNVLANLDGAKITGASIGTNSEGVLSTDSGKTPTFTDKTVSFYVNNVTKENKTGTISVTIESTNYQNITATLKIITEHRDDAGVSITGAPLVKTYGEADFTLTATAKMTGTNGTWTWSSSEASVLTVTQDETDENKATVHILKASAGGAIIKATYASDTTYGDYEADIIVNPKEVTITGLSAGDKTYDGSTTATVTGTATIAGKVDGDGLTVTAGTAAFESASVGENKTVTFSGYSLSGTAESNYTLKAQPASVTAAISPKTINLSISPLTIDSQTYTGNQITPTVTVSSSEVVTNYALTKDIDYTVTYGENVDAGTGSVAISPVSGSNYTFTKVIETFTINKADPTVTAPTANTYLTYTGSAKHLVNAGSTTGGTMMYSTDKTTWESSAMKITGTNAGTYTVYYYVLGDTNYNDCGSADDPAGSVEVSIDKAVQTASASATVLYSDTDEQSVSIKDVIEDYLLSTDRPAYGAPHIESGSEKLSGTPVMDANGNLTFALVSGLTSEDASASVTVNVTDLANYEKVTVTVNISITADNPVTVDMSGITLENKPYDGMGIDYAGMASGTTRDGSAYTGNISYKWYDSKGKELSEAPKNAGTYTLKAIVTDTGYVGNGVKTVIIFPAQLTIKALNKSAAIGDSAPGLENPVENMDYTVTGLAWGEKLETLPTLAYETPPDMTKAGTYTIKASGAAADSNYTIEYVDGTLTVSKRSYNTDGVKKEDKTVTVDMSGVTLEDKAYDGNALDYTGEADGDNGYTGGFTYEWYDSDGNKLSEAPKDAGTYTLKAIVSGSGYTGTGEKTVTISPAQLIVRALDKTAKVGDASAPDLSDPVPGTDYTVTGLMGNDTLTTPPTLAYEISPDMTKAGTYAIKASGADAGSNYTIQYEDGLLTISKRIYTVTVKSGKGGKASASTVSAAKGTKVTLTASADSDYTFSGWTSSDVTISNASRTTATFTMPEKNVTVTASWKKKTGSSLLIAWGTVSGSGSVKISWKKASGAAGYEIYGADCGKVGNCKLLKRTAGTSWTQKNLNNKKIYKYYVKAYKYQNGKKVYLAKSPAIHVAMKNAAKTNVSRVTVSRSSVSLSAGKTLTLKVSCKKQNSKKKLVDHVSRYRFFTSDSSVATVNSAGKITAKSWGTCTIYVMANDGYYKTVKVTVK